jgi:hypothetical protein
MVMLATRRAAPLVLRGAMEISRACETRTVGGKDIVQIRPARRGALQKSSEIRIPGFF